MPAAAALLHDWLHQDGVQPTQWANKRLHPVAARTVHPDTRARGCPVRYRHVLAR